MLLNNLGKSGLEVSALGFGAMSLSGKDEAADMKLIRTAYSEGVCYFDTADLYAKGENEVLLGKGIKAFRKEIILATKVGNVWNETGDGWGWDVSKEYINRAVDASLKRLQTDYLDLYQLHGGTIADNFDEVIDIFERLKTSGKIRAYGLSSIRPNVFGYYAKVANISSNMMQYSMLDTRPEEYLDFLKSQEVGVIARGVLGQGLLVNKPAVGYVGLDVGAAEAIQRKVKSIALGYGVSSSAVALTYVLRNAAVCTALVGARTVAQFNQLIQAYKEMEKLQSAVLDGMGAQLRYEQHL
ncbi:aldo/keto reductase [Sphingobacterium faecale]|uniref:Aldo/keto reductase n=1 Tax=Sphingobacterium faecale TaxID=2803775 RepID=A0ABS1R2K2_9SPHI|nr:aldo/keto reductase [Sphingobacterium faecale]MBL1408779.1 aldo/keto reductase [Sphingobacterium faecale]